MGRAKPTLRRFVEELVSRHGGNKTAAATASGIDRTRIGKILDSEDGSDSFELATCLRLARAIGRRPSDVLGAAGKPDDIQLIVDLFGPSTIPAAIPPDVLMSVSPREKAVIEALRIVEREEASRE